MPRKAAELYLFGLLRRPDDVRMLQGLVEVWTSLGKYRESLPYAQRLFDLEPNDYRAQALLHDVEEALDKVSKSKEQASNETARESKPESGKAKEEESKRKKKETVLSREVKLKALKLMKAIASAKMSYDLNHRGEEMQELDIEKLQKEKLLPKSLDLSPWKDSLKLAQGSIAIDEVGSLPKLEEELSEYRADLNRCYSLIYRDELPEALDQAERLMKKYPESIETFLPRIFTLVSTRHGKASRRLAKKVIELKQDDPQDLFGVLMILYRSGDYREAKKAISLLNNRFTETHWAKLAGEVSLLIDRNVGFDLLSNLITARKEFFDSLQEDDEEDKDEGKGKGN